MPRVDGRSWVTYNAWEQHDRRVLGVESWVPWGYYLRGRRQGIRPGAIHPQCAIAIGAEERDGGRRLRLTTWLEERGGSPRRNDPCTACSLLLFNSRGNFRLRVAPLRPDVNHNVFWACSQGRRMGANVTDRWTVVTPPRFNIAPIEQEGLLPALQVARAAMPAGFTLCRPLYGTPDDALEPTVTFTDASYDGLDGTRAQQGRISTIQRGIQSNEQQIRIYLEDVAVMQQHIASQRIEMERNSTGTSALIPRRQLAEFLSQLGAVRDWVLDTHGLYLNLWPVKLYNDVTGVAVMTTPHSWSVVPSQDNGFTITVNGAHPHWAGRRYCAGQYAAQMEELMARGNILQALRLLLELRRGWAEADQYVDIQSVARASFEQFRAAIMGSDVSAWKYYEDGHTAEILPFVQDDAMLIGRSVRR